MRYEEVETFDEVAEVAKKKEMTHRLHAES
jgi:hypothetical protein